MAHLRGDHPCSFESFGRICQLFAAIFRTYLCTSRETKSSRSRSLAPPRRLGRFRLWMAVDGFWGCFSWKILRKAAWQEMIRDCRDTNHTEKSLEGLKQIIYDSDGLIWNRLECWGGVGGKISSPESGLHPWPQSCWSRILRCRNPISESFSN